jgi:hypothetical protein
MENEAHHDGISSSSIWREERPPRLGFVFQLVQVHSEVQSASHLQSASSGLAKYSVCSGKEPIANQVLGPSNPLSRRPNRRCGGAFFFAPSTLLNLLNSQSGQLD